jgi:hypothetical protein
VALRREQWEQFESNHRENQAMRKEGENDHKCHKHSPRKRRNGGMPVGYSGLITIRREQCGIFTQGKNRKASRDSRYQIMTLQTSMFPQQQLDTTIMGNSVFYTVRAEML